MNIRPQDRSPEQATADELAQALRGGYLGLRGTFLQLKRLVWQNPHGLTPQQVLDLIGPADGDGLSAAGLFAISNGCVQLLNLIGEGIEGVVPRGVMDTLNPDGTVTLGAE